MVDHSSSKFWHFSHWIIADTFEYFSIFLNRKHKNSWEKNILYPMDYCLCGHWYIYFPVYEDSAELLIGNAADLNAKDTDGYTPLCLCAQYGKFLSLRTNKYHTGKNLFNLFLNWLDRPIVAKLLIAGGANINEKCKGDSPLHAAAQRGKIAGRNKSHWRLNA